MKVQDLIHILCRLPQDTEICVCRKKVVGVLEDDELPNTANLLVLAESKTIGDYMFSDTVTL